MSNIHNSDVSHREKAGTHTPGPWTYLGDRIAAPCHEHPDCEKTILWTGISRPSDHPGTFQCSIGPHDKANARLIAAAPDLLASAKELRDALAAAFRVLSQQGNNTASNQFFDEMDRLGIKPGIGVRADAAIAKAEGSA